MTSFPTAIKFIPKVHTNCVFVVFLFKITTSLGLLAVYVHSNPLRNPINYLVASIGGRNKKIIPIVSTEERFKIMTGQS